MSVLKNVFLVAFLLYVSSHLGLSACSDPVDWNCYLTGVKPILITNVNDISD